MKKWRLQNKHERRFKQGHPWVYSNELQDSPKGIESGEVLELQDSGGKFLAYGIANPASLIAFRALSREIADGPHLDSKIHSEFFFQRFNEAYQFRQSWFSSNHSYRLVYGEVDGCPGLVIDRYWGRAGAGPAAPVYVIQPHSAGMDRNLGAAREALSRLSREQNEPEAAVCIERRDAASREREGMEKLPPKVINLHTGAEVTQPDDYRDFLLTVPGVMGSTVELSADLVSGQKTGFFLDQLQNIKLVEGLLLRFLRRDRNAVEAGTNARQRSFKVLDLCSYVGQWSVHLSQTVIERESLPLSVTLVDASDAALRFAEKNMQHLIRQYSSAQTSMSEQIHVHKLKADVLEPMPSLAEDHYDVVIADPPALIKNRKHLPQGQHAYVNLMTTALNKARPGGLVVACSCSQLLSTDDFKIILDKASRRSGKRVRWIAQGSPSVDHFNLMNFQEGHYLKCFVGQVSGRPEGANLPVSKGKKP